MSMKNYIKPFFIGNVKIDGPIVLAPMADISNSAFRQIIKDAGANLLYAEMVSDKAICYENKKTENLLKMTDKEHPISQQIFGSDKKTFVEATKRIIDLMHPDIIDINMGCPVPKVALKAQAGSALLKNPEKIREIVSSVVRVSPVPVTVKIRSGWDENSINAVEVAKICEEAGASAICLHARTRKQGYSGKADWSLIKKVKENVNIPVIGNGDVTSPELFVKMLDETGCDAVMIGRAVIGNPFLIKQISEYLKYGKVKTYPTVKDKIDMLKKHFELLEKNNQNAILEIRSQALAYIKGLDNSKELKRQIVTAKSKEELFCMLDNYLNTCS